MKIKKFFCLIFLANCMVVQGKTIWVDYHQGKGGNSGTEKSPLPNFRGAIKLAKPGDTIKIIPSPTPIIDAIRVNNVSGLADKPIVIDGMNNSFTGVAPLNMREWKELQPGVFHKQVAITYNMVSRYFMVWNGKIQRMGRYTKATGRKPFKKLADLQSGEWTIIPEGEGNPKSIKKWNFYLKLPQGAKTPMDINAAEPVISQISGVIIKGRCHNLKFQNITVKHFINDGFNIHDDAQNIRFENIVAIECGDDGISDHDSGKISIKNYLSIGNSTAICHIQKAQCDHENVYAFETLGRDIHLMDEVKCTLKSVYIEGTSAQGILVREKVKLLMDNCIFLNKNPNASFKILTPEITVHKVNFYGYKKTNEIISKVMKITPKLPTMIKR